MCCDALSGRGEFIPTIVPSWVGSPQEHPAADAADAGLTVQEAAHLLRKGFLDHACFLFFWQPPPPCWVPAFASPELVPLSTHASPAGGSAPPWRGTSASGSSWATHASFLQDFKIFYLRFQWKCLARGKLGKCFEEGGTDAWTGKDVVEATFELELEMCQIFWAVPSW